MVDTDDTRHIDIQDRYNRQQTVDNRHCHVYGISSRPDHELHQTMPNVELLRILSYFNILQYV